MNTTSIKKMMAPLKVSPLEVATLQLNEAQIKLLNQFRFVVQSLLQLQYDIETRAKRKKMNASDPIFQIKLKCLERKLEFKTGEIGSLLSMLAKFRRSKNSESLIESASHVKSEEVYLIESAPSVTNEVVIEIGGDRDVIASRVDSPDTARIKQSSRQPRNSERNKRFLKCVFLVLTVAVESCQAVFTQENGTTNMKHPIYLNLSIACSSLCLFMSLIEALHEARSRGVMWQHRSGFRGCFHYPGPHPRPFTEFSIYFGILCSSLQLILNVTTKVTHKNFVKFDYVPLLLSICHLVAAMVGHQEENSAEAIVNCKIHGYNPTTAIVLAQKPPPKNLVFECPKCQLQDLPEFSVLPINSS